MTSSNLDGTFGSNNVNCLTCKAKSPLFHYLSKAELEKVDQNRCHVRYKAGETIRKQGARLSHVISVTGGMCKMYIEGIEYRDIILGIIKPTNFIGGPGLYADNSHHFTVSAITNTTVCIIDSQGFKLIMEQNQEFANEFIKDMSKNMISVYKRLISLTQKQMPGRIADALLYFSNEVFETRSFDLPLTKQEMSDFTKMSKDNVVRILRSFHNDGIISYSSEQVHIKDYNKLMLISSTG